jgi:hypothetical protein
VEGSVWARRRRERSVDAETGGWKLGGVEEEEDIGRLSEGVRAW